MSREVKGRPSEYRAQGETNSIQRLGNTSTILEERSKSHGRDQSIIEAALVEAKLNPGFQLCR